METSIVIMAAGMGSRFKGGIKQLTPVGEQGETLMEYSVCDAVKAGFDRVIFIIRREIENEFIAKVGHLSDKYGVKIQYVFQDINDIPVKADIKRIKPWGTGHALLAARNIIDSPFAVINSDDFYGSSAFKKVHDFLLSIENDSGILKGCMVGYAMKNSIGSNGKVNRAVCRTDGGILTGVSEYYEISWENGRIIGKNEQGTSEELSGECLASMNFFGFTEGIIPELEKRFTDFLNKLHENADSEFIIPNILGEMINEKKIEITVLQSDEDTFGMTRAEDMEEVREKIRSLSARGVYDNTYAQ